MTIFTRLFLPSYNLPHLRLLFSPSGRKCSNIHMLSTALYFFLLRNTYYLLHNRLINSPEIILWHYNKNSCFFWAITSWEVVKKSWWRFSSLRKSNISGLVIWTVSNVDGMIKVWDSVSLQIRHSHTEFIFSTCMLITRFKMSKNIMLNFKPLENFCLPYITGKYQK